MLLGILLGGYSQLQDFLNPLDTNPLIEQIPEEDTETTEFEEEGLEEKPVEDAIEENDEEVEIEEENEDSFDSEVEEAATDGELDEVEDNDQDEEEEE